MTTEHKPHQELIAAFRAWAMADENPNALWSIDRCVAQELFEQTTALRAGLEELLSVAERIRGGDSKLDPEEWYAARDYARKVLSA